MSKLRRLIAKGRGGAGSTCGNRPLMIAEVGVNHEGCMKTAFQLIDDAAEAGADAVKFQTHIAEAETLRSAPNPPYFKDETRFEYFERTAFTLEQHQKLMLPLLF